MGTQETNSGALMGPDGKHRLRDEVLSEKDHPESMLDDVTIPQILSTTVGDIEGSRVPVGEQAEMPRVKFAILFAGMLLSNFLVMLDATIASTALPRIVSDFDALGSAPFIASAYFLPEPSCILTFGQIMTVANGKWLYLSAICIFELGSIICGAAPNMNVLIFGRVLAGVGAAGLGVTCLALLARIVPMEKRAFLFGLFGLNVALGSVAGPLMGGALVDRASWRWCFYINLPLGVICVASILFTLDSARCTALADTSLSVWERITGIDWIGSIFCLGMMTSLLLPLQWGGVTIPWSDKTITACFCVFAVLAIMFIGWEWHIGDKGIMPLSLLKRRTQVGCCLFMFFTLPVFLLGVYYLPLYYQSAEEHTAIRSGIDILIFMISAAIATTGGGVAVGKTGRPLPFLTIPPLVAALACGLIFWTLLSEQPSKLLLVFQVLLGLGNGAGAQNSLVPIQAEYANSPRLVPLGISLVRFAQFAGGMIFIAIAGAIFENRLDTLIHRYAPNLAPSIALLAKQSPAVIRTLHGQDQENIIKAYSQAIAYTFVLGLALSLVASFSGLMIKNFDLRKGKQKPEAAGRDKK